MMANPVAMEYVNASINSGLPVTSSQQLMQLQQPPHATSLHPPLANACLVNVNNNNTSSSSNGGVGMQGCSSSSASSSVTGPASSSSPCSLPPPQAPPPVVPHMGTQVIHILGGRKLSSNDPSDEASDEHEYYNEYQRELQPLHHRRNETTV